MSKVSRGVPVAVAIVEKNKRIEELEAEVERQRERADHNFRRGNELWRELGALRKQHEHAWDMEAEAQKLARKLRRQLALANESVQGYYEKNKRLQAELATLRIRLGICPECQNEECMADGVNLWCPACDASYTTEES